MELTRIIRPGKQVHLFGEGKINQPLGKKVEEVVVPPRPPWKLLRFKWGVYVVFSLWYNGYRNIKG